MASQTLTAASTTVVRVNLLPPEIDEKRKARRVQAGMACAAAAAVGVVGVMYVGQTAKLSSAKEDLAAAEARHATLRKDRAALNNVSATYAKLDAAETMLRDAMGQEVRWASYVNALSLSMPEGVWIEEMQVKQVLEGFGLTAAGPATSSSGALLSAGGIGTVTFKGRAFVHEDVAVWLETLAKQKGYVNPYFAKSEIDKNSARRIVVYESNVTVTRNAYSNRYTAKQARS